jgi:hypothetical protein
MQHRSRSSLRHTPGPRRGRGRKCGDTECAFKRRNENSEARVSTGRSRVVDRRTTISCGITEGEGGGGDCHERSADLPVRRPLSRGLSDCLLPRQHHRKSPTCAGDDRAPLRLTWAGPHQCPTRKGMLHYCRERRTLHCNCYRARHRMPTGGQDSWCECVPLGVWVGRCWVRISVGACVNGRFGANRRGMCGSGWVGLVTLSRGKGPKRLKN